jgi:hypothetical protein
VRIILKALFWTAVINGLLAPFLLVGILFVACDRKLMQDQPSSMLSRVVVVTTCFEGIRVNGVAPGPIWTPLIPSTFPGEKVKTFGSDTPMKRAGQPEEVASSFIFLASDDSSYMSGQVLHPNGGTVING